MAECMSKRMTLTTTGDKVRSGAQTFDRAAGFPNT